MVNKVKAFIILGSHDVFTLDKQLEEISSQLLPSTRASRYLLTSASLLTASSDTLGALGKQTKTILMLSRLP